MSKCQNCKHDCHCQNNLHKDDVGVCKCSDCKCKRTYKKQKDHATDMSFENEIKYDGEEYELLFYRHINYINLFTNTN